MSKFTTSEILYIHENCLNTKRAFATSCRLCIDSCPHKAISEFKELDPDLCTECGLCMAICPSDGFVSRSFDDLFDYIISTDQVNLNCPKAIRKDFEIPCLGMFDRDSWRSLLLVAQEKPVTIYTGVCAGCPDKYACGKSIQTLKEFDDIQLSDILLAIKVSPDSDEGLSSGSNKHPLSRRETIEGWRQQNKEKLEALLPVLNNASGGYPVPKSREKIIKMLENRSETRIPFRAITVSDNCTSCGVCAAICPQGALQKREVGNTFKLILEPFRCVQCDRCIEICRPQALKYASKNLSHKHLTGRILLHEGSPLYCSRCGKQVFENNDQPLCIACASSDPDKNNFFF